MLTACKVNMPDVKIIGHIPSDVKDLIINYSTCLNMKIQIQTEKQHGESHVSTRSYSVLHEVSLMWLLLNLCYLTLPLNNHIMNRTS